MSPFWVIQVEGPAFGPPLGIEGEFVVRFDPEKNGGRGELITHASLDRAQRFECPEDAVRFYRQQSATVPRRPDGRPNRPLTAFAVTVRRGD